MVGYGRNPPDPRWPGGARIAVQFVLNYEEGGENSILHGDAASEAFLSEIVGAQPWPGMRHMNMESIYEYGARAGFWRLWRMFTGARLPVTVYRRRAPRWQRNPEAVAAMQRGRLGDRQPRPQWIEYKDFGRRRGARAHAARRSASIREVTGERPLGWYTGRSARTRCSSSSRRAASSTPPTPMPTTCPTGCTAGRRPHLIVPYTLDANDMRFATPQGFNSGDQFFTYLKDSFDVLYAEGEDGAPKMMSVGPALPAGRPARAAPRRSPASSTMSQAHEQVWVCRRVDIARHWHEHHAAA